MSNITVFIIVCFLVSNVMLSALFNMGRLAAALMITCNMLFWYCVYKLVRFFM
jgi:hypothetical protein